jgi:hypothetical protein
MVERLKEEFGKWQYVSSHSYENYVKMLGILPTVCSVPGGFLRLFGVSIHPPGKIGYGGGSQHGDSGLWEEFQMRG